MEGNRERSTTEDRVVEYLVEWLCQLTGKPKSEFENMSSYELYEILTVINPDVSTRPRKRKSSESKTENTPEN